MVQTDVAIVGAGPIGLELAVALRHAGIECLQFDSGQIGQTVSWYPRQARFFSGPQRIAIAGVPLVTQDQSKATREEYLAYLRSVVEQFDLTVRTYERVIALKPDEGGFILSTRGSRGETSYWAQRVVLALGDMHAPRRLHIPGEDLDHVSHYFEEPHRYFRKRLLIVGGRNSAVEAAIRCHRVGAEVALSYRGTTFDRNGVKYWLLPEFKGLIKHGKIDFYPATEPTCISTDTVTLKQVSGLDTRAKGDTAEAVKAGENARQSNRETHNDRAGDELTTVPADFVLLLTGYVQDATLFDMAGVERTGKNQAPKLDPGTNQTNVPGLFVAGTAAAGTQHHFRLFIENCHHHVTKIVRAITGAPPPAALVNQAASSFDLPES